MKSVKLYIVLVGIILCFHPPGRVAAQDITNFTQFYFNPSLINSSLTGIDGQPALYLSYKKQWAGFTGSPAISNLNFQTSLPSNVGLGVNLNNSKSGQLNISTIHFSGAYSVSLGTDQFLRFGLSAGVSSTQVDVNSLNFGTPNDPILTDLVKSNMQLVGNFGVSYHNKDFHFGLSLPTIFEPTYWNRDAFTISKVDPFGSMIIHASNRFYINKSKNVFEPYALYRLNSGLPGQFEFAGVFHLQEVVYVGASYKQDFGISALAGFKLNKVMALGYSYTVQNAGENQVNKPSHEIQLGLLLGQRQKDVQAYSFIDTDKKSKAQIAAEKAAEKKALAKKQQEEKARQAAAAAEAKKKADEEKKRLAAEKHKQDSLAMTADQHRLEQEQLSRIDQHAKNPKEEHNDLNHPNKERHEIVKQGDHVSELDVADYVIVGAFKLEANAKRYADDLVKLGFKDAQFGFLTPHKVWYVYISQSNDIEAARQFRDQFRKMKIFRDAWLLTVIK
jgi:type IX secretion system PorP/SprF family membrane protein